MPELPRVSGKDAIAAFSSHGFVLDRIRGSYHVLKKPGYMFVLTVPVHGNRPLKAGTLRGLIRGAGLTVEDFVAALQR